MTEEYVPSKKPYSGGKWVVRLPGGTELEFKETAADSPLAAAQLAAAQLFANTLNRDLVALANGRPAVSGGKGEAPIPLQVWTPGGEETTFAAPVASLTDEGDGTDSHPGGGVSESDPTGDGSGGDARQWATSSTLAGSWKRPAISAAPW